MKVIVTRPHTDAATFVDLLQSKGIETVFSPMMTIKFNERQVPADQSDCELGALAFTSANGVRAYISQSNVRKDIPAFAVGKETARLCRAEGFNNVLEASGDVISLSRLIAEKFQTRNENSFVGHIAGKERAGDLIVLLQKHSILSKRFVLYEASPAATFSKEATKILGEKAAIGVTFFSPRTVEIFFSLLEKPTPPIIAYCLSDAVGAAVKTASTNPDNPMDRLHILISKERTASSLAAEIFNDLAK